MLPVATCPRLHEESGKSGRDFHGSAARPRKRTHDGPFIALAFPDSCDRSIPRTLCPGQAFVRAVGASRGSRPWRGYAATTVLAQGDPVDTRRRRPRARRRKSEVLRPAMSRPEFQDLHHNLGITAAQRTQWRDFAQVMRDNAEAIDAILKERSANITTMNAVDDLRSYQKLADAHADGMKKLVPAFEALYNTMSDEQKKNADAVFGKFSRDVRSTPKSEQRA